MSASPPTLYTGLDLHKRSLTAATLDADGTLLDQQKIPCHPDALRLYFAEHAAGPGGQPRWAASGGRRVHDGLVLGRGCSGYD